jgi:hypothetical protein
MRSLLAEKQRALTARGMMSLRRDGKRPKYKVRGDMGNHRVFKAAPPEQPDEKWDKEAGRLRAHGGSFSLRKTIIPSSPKSGSATTAESYILMIADQGYVSARSASP